MSKDGVKVNPTKVDVVMKWEPPKTPIELRSFVGFVGYYRHFIREFLTWRLL